MKYFIYTRKSQEAEDRQIMSLQSQIDEVLELCERDLELEIVDRYEESQSAKKPGRPLFEAMLSRIERGEAEGIIAWHPDRIARNAVDGGRIIHLLDSGQLKDLRFCSYSFENNPQGKFMLNIIFGYSKYYVDNLSQNVKRGIKTKLGLGWRPNRAPIGYKNCKDSRTIIPDPAHFKVVKKMFDLALAGHSASHIHRLACEDWNYRMPMRKTMGGNKPARSTIFKILQNPFYAGKIRWAGATFNGNHQPVLSWCDFRRVQKNIRSGHPKPKPKTLSFPYTGLMQCHSCGLAVTAEQKVRNGVPKYIYYHCTRRRSDMKCVEPSIEGHNLERQVMSFVADISLDRNIVSWFCAIAAENHTTLEAAAASQKKRAVRELASASKRLDRLTDLYVADRIDETEFETKRTELEAARSKAKERAENFLQSENTFEHAHLLIMFLSRAVEWFKAANDSQKRRLLQILCSNSTLGGKIARFTAAKPFQHTLALPECLRVCRHGTNVRTSKTPTYCEPLETWLTKLTELPELENTIKDVRDLAEELDPSALDGLQRFRGEAPPANQDE